MPENPAILRSPFHSWITYISLLFLGFFPGAFLMHAQREQRTNPVTLEYDLVIVRVPKNADLSKIPDIADWSNPSIRRPLYEKGWRVLSEPKLESAYPCHVGMYVGAIAGFDSPTSKSPEYSVRFFTQASGANLQTHVDFYSDTVAISHNLLHLAGQTTAIQLTNSQPQENYRYFLLFKVTPHNQFQVGGPLTVPAGGTTVP